MLKDRFTNLHSRSFRLRMMIASMFSLAIKFVAHKNDFISFKWLSEVAFLNKQSIPFVTNEFHLESSEKGVRVKKSMACI